MTKTVAALLLVALLSCASTPPNLSQPLPAASPRDRLEQEQATILVDTTCAYTAREGDAGLIVRGQRGSGVLISRRVAITAAHVITCPHRDGYLEGRPIVDVTGVDGDRHSARIEAVDPTRDLARLRASSEVAPVGPPRFGRVAVGEPICSSTAVPKREHHCGYVRKVHYRARTDGDVDHTALSLAGNSGGAFYDLAGDVVGIVISLQWCTAQRLDSCGGSMSSVPASLVVP